MNNYSILKSIESQVNAAEGYTADYVVSDDTVYVKQNGAIVGEVYMAENTNNETTYTVSGIVPYIIICDYITINQGGGLADRTKRTRIVFEG